VRGFGERVADVQRLVRGARRIAGDPALRDAIVRSSGLSREGVDRAFERHLETDPSDADLASLVRAAGDAERVHVVLSANVFVAALRAIALARAAATRVTVRPSSRDAAFPRALVEAAGDPAIELADEADLGAIARGEVHVYGRDATIDAVRAAVRPGVIVRGHGAGLGVACVLAGAAGDPDAALRESAMALAEDVVPFDQRGCSSPRVAFVVGDEHRASRFVRHMHDALNAAEARVPRGDLGAGEREGAARYADAVAFAGELLRGPAHLVGMTRHLAVPPPGRHVHVVPAPSLDDVAAILRPIARQVVAVGLSGAARRDAFPAHARVTPLGRMQRPPLDGPVDLRPAVRVSKDG